MDAGEEAGAANADMAGTGAGDDFCAMPPKRAAAIFSFSVSTRGAAGAGAVVEQKDPRLPLLQAEANDDWQVGRAAGGGA